MFPSIRHYTVIIRILSSCLLTIISLSVFSQVEYYWVGGTGQWEDFSHHWATTSGGSIFHTAKPHTGCNVIFDQNSFSAQNQIVIVGDPNIFCHDMTWNNVPDGVTFLCGANININGSMILASNMLLQNNSGVTTFDSDFSEVINTGGSQNPIKNVTFNGNGIWTLQNYLNVDNDITLDKGTVVTANNTLKCSKFISTPAINTNNRILDLGSSLFIIKSPNNPPYLSWNVDNSMGTFHVLSNGNSLIQFIGSFGLSTMHAGINLNYDDVEFMGPGRLEIDFDTIRDATFHGPGEIIGDTNIVHDAYFFDYGMINGHDNIFNDVTMEKDGDIGNLTLFGRNVDHNHFHTVEIYHRGRVYGNGNIFNDLLFSTHPENCCPECLNCVYCGYYQDGELHGNQDTVYHNLTFVREGKIFGTLNYFNNTTFWCDGWVLQGSNDFMDLNLYRHYQECFGSIPQYDYPVSIHKNVLTLQQDSTQHLINDFNLLGDFYCEHTLVQSTSSTVAAHFNSDSVLVIDYIELHNIHSANPMNIMDTAIRSLDAGGNDFWFFDLTYDTLQPGQNTVIPVSPCYGNCSGSIILDPAGGIPPYLYSIMVWDPGLGYFTYWTNFQTADTFSGLCSLTYPVRIVDYYGCLLGEYIPVGSPPQLQLIDTLIKHISCYGMNDGKITFIVTGGTGPLTFSLDYGPFVADSLFTGLTPGSHTVIVHDSLGCSATFGPFIILEPPDLSVTTGGADILVKCHADSTAVITAIPLGGTPPYTYTYIGPINSSIYLCDTVYTVNTSILGHAGIWKVIVTDSNDCSDSTMTQRFEPPPIEITITTGSSNNCEDTLHFYATAQAIGGTPPYLYQWYTNTGILMSFGSLLSNIPPGTYWVKVTDSYLCADSLSATIDILSDTVLSIHDKHCKNGSFDGDACIQGVGGSGQFTYLWSLNELTTPCIFYLDTGTYYVSVTDQVYGCTVHDSVYIGQPDSVLTVQMFYDSTSCNGVNDGQAWLWASGGTPPYRYQWSNGLGNNDTVMGLPAGIYTVTVTDTLGCTVTGSVTIYSPPPGSVSFQHGWHCTPQGYWAIAIATGGTAPYTYTWSPSYSTTNQVEGPPGIYTVNVVDVNGCSFNGNIELPEFNPGVSIHDVDCYNGSTGYATVNTSNGNPPYSYQWYQVGIPIPIDGDDSMQNQPAGDYYLSIIDSFGCQHLVFFSLSQPQQPLTVDVSSNSTLNFCFQDCNGFAVVQPEGGTPPYSYSWSPGNMTSNTVTNLCQGDYSVQVTDYNGCLMTGNTIVNSPPELIIDSVVVIPLNCNQPGYFGSATVYAHGGTGILHYSVDGQPFYLSSAFTGLTAGIHYYSVRDDNFCVVTSSFSVNAPPVLQVVISGQGPTAFGGSDGWLLAGALGGTPGYLYTWSNGVSDPLNNGLPQGIYSVTVTDAHGCQISKDTILSSPGELILSVTYNDLQCNGINTGSITAMASGGVLPYTFYWSTGEIFASVTSSSLNDLSPGIYGVTVTDHNNISRNQSITITQPAPWQSTLNFPDSICPGTTDGYASINISGNTFPYTFSWNAGLGANTDSIYQLVPGNYSVTVTDDHNCTFTSMVTISSYYSPVAQFILNDVCLGNTTTLTNNSYVDNSILTLSGVTWGDGNIDTVNLPSTTLQHLYQNPGIYTVSMWVEDVNQCFSQLTSQEVTVFSIPNAEFIYDTACFGNVTHLADISADNGFPIVNQWWSIENNIIYNQNLLNYTFAQYGNHTVKLYTENELHCLDSVMYHIPVDSLPYPGFIYHDSVCVAGMVSFRDQSLPNGSPIQGWYYEFGDGNSSVLSDPIHTYLQTGQIYPVSLTVTSERGCSSQISQVVDVSKPFILQLHADTVCFGEPTHFTGMALSPPGDNIIWQYWYFGDGTSVLDTDPYHFYSSPGIYTAVLSAIDEHGCEETTFDSLVTVYPLPTAGFTYSVACTQAVVTFSSTSLSGVPGGLTLMWDFGDGSGIVTTTNPVIQHTYPGPGTYMVSLKAVNDELCENSVTINVIVEYPAQPDFTTDAACPGSPLSFTDITSPTPIGWQWDFGDPGSGINNTSTVQNPGHIYSSPGTYTVTLSITNQNDCIFTVSKVITIITPPTALFTYNAANSCQNDTLLFTDLSTSPTGSITGWLWTFDDLNSGFNNHSGLQHPGHLFTEAGYYDVSLIVAANTGNGCKDTATLLVTVRPHPLADFNYSLACQGDSTQFIDASTGISASVQSYYWDFGDGFTSSLPDPWHIFSTAGTYLVRHVVWDEYGCSDTIIKPFTVLSPPLPEFSHSTLCLNNPVQFTDISNPVSGTIVAWYWDFGDPGSGFNNYSTLQNPVHTFQSPGIYTVIHAAITSFGCRDTIQSTITITATPMADFTSSDTCLGFITQFQDFSSTSSGAILSWNWNFGDGQSSLIQNPVHQYQSSGTHYATLTITDAAQCVSSVTLPVIVFPLPNPLFTAQISCSQSPVFFTNLSNGGGFPVTSWSWNFGDPSTTLDISNLQNPNYTYPEQGFYDVSLTMTNTEGCTNQTSQTIFVPAGAFADFSVDTLQSCQNLPVHFQDLSFGIGSNIISWFWDFHDGTTSTQINPSHTFLSPGMHPVTLTVTTLNGCIKSITKNIMIYSLPTATYSYSGQCFGFPTEFFGLAGGSNLPVIQWEWDFGDPASGSANSSSLQNPTHIFSSPGTYIVHLSVTDSKHCTNSYITGISIYDVPVAAFTFSQQTCHSDTVCFTDASAYNGTVPFSWQWQFGDPASGVLNVSDLSGPCHIYSATSDYNVSLLVTNSFGCQDDTTANILLMQGQSPTADFQFTTECFGHPTQFTETAVAGGAPIVSYYWDFDDPQSGPANNISSFPNPQHLFTTAGIFHVSLTVASQDLCSHTFTIPVTVKATPFPGFSHNGDCQNATILFEDTSLTNGSALISWSWMIDGEAMGALNAFSTFFSIAGNHTISLNVLNQQGCDSTASLTLLVYPAPVADFTMNPATACKSETISFSASSSQPGFGQVTSYQWNFGDGSPVFTSTTPFASHQYGTVGNYDVALSVMNSHGCIDSIHKTITIKPLPVPSIQVTSPTCLLDTVHFTSSSTLPNGGSIQSYQWNFGDPSSGPNNFSTFQNPTHIFTPLAGNYQVTLLVHDGYCSNQTQQTIQLHSLPLVNFSFDTACLGETTHFTDLSTSQGSSIASWSWSLGPGNSNIQNPSVLYGTAGYHPVTLTVNDDHSCHNHYSRLVPVDSLPIPNFTYHDTCSPNINAGQIAFSDQSLANGSPIISWLWQLTPGNTSLLQNPVYIFNTVNQTYPVTLTVTSARGCSNSLTQNVYVNPPLQINFSALSSCYQDSTYFVPEILEPPAVSPENWIWHFGDGSPIYSGTGDTTAHLFLLPGSYYVVLQQTLSNGCTDSLGKFITVNPLPVPDFTYDTTYCDNVTHFIDQSSAVNNNIISWAWNFGDPLSGASNVSSLQNPEHQYPSQGGIFQVNLTVMTADSCMNSASLPVIHGPCINAEFVIIDTLACNNLPITFHDSSIIGGSSVVQAWKWNFGDGSPDYIYSIYQDPVLHTYLQPGNYTVSLIILVESNDIQYSDTVFHTLVIFPTPLADFQTDSCCRGDSIHLVNQSTIQSGSISSWYWSFGDNTTSLQENPPPHFYVNAGTYNVTLTISSDHNCSAVRQKLAHVWPEPHAGFTASPNDFCGIPDSVFFTDQSSIIGGNISQYIYYLGYGQPVFSGAGDHIFIYNQYGSFTVGLTVITDKGCRDSLFYPSHITIKPKPQPSFTFTPEIVTIMNPVVQFTDQTFSSGGHSCIWDFGDGTGGVSGDCYPIHTFADTGWYLISLYVIGQNSCDSIYYDSLYIQGDLTAYVPNAFSPDGDNNNDYFGPIGTYIDPSDYLMLIYNRWGEEIYQTTNLGKPWDGKVKDSEDIAPVGVYVYYIRVKDLYGGRKEFRGTVLLLKKD